MQNRSIFVQEPDYIGFRKTYEPVKALGIIYDGDDPYATPLGVVLALDETAGGKREIFVPRDVRKQGGKTVYLHDLGQAQYVGQRNGFEESQLELDNEALDEGSKTKLRTFFAAQNRPETIHKYAVDVCG